MAKVAILMGSDSDWEAMAEAAAVLEELGVPAEVEVLSAHRSPARVIRFVEEAEGRGVRVFICGAGLAAHLAGAVAAHTTRPVLGVPLAAGTLGGLDALLATVQMPPGVPVGTLAIGKVGARNAGVLAAQILAVADPDLAERLTAMKGRLEEKVVKAGESLRRKREGR